MWHTMGWRTLGEGISNKNISAFGNKRKMGKT
jgi:hypothetical protein